MSWRDIYIISTTCCSPGEKRHIWEEAHKYADQLHVQNSNDVEPAAQKVPDQELNWDYNAGGGNRNMSTMI